MSPCIHFAGQGRSHFNTATAVTVMPGIGMVVREYIATTVHFLVTRDVIAMARMSRDRVAWMVAVARGLAITHRDARCASMTGTRTILAIE